MDQQMRERVERGLARGWILRLLPRHHVYLHSPQAGGERFVRLFRATWGRLPCHARRRILRHWKTGGDHLNFRPTIELLGDWAGRIGGEGLDGTKAAAGGDGHALRFRKDIVDAYPDDLVMDLIAHELAHIFGYASGWYRDGVEDPFRDEEEADALVEVWGFSSTAMDDWDLDHGVGEPDFTEMDEGARARWLEEQRELSLRCGR
jgi:hypothetical protein